MRALRGRAVRALGLLSLELLSKVLSFMGNGLEWCRGKRYGLAVVQRATRCRCEVDCDLGNCGLDRGAILEFVAALILPDQG